MTIGQALPILICAGLWLLPTAAQDSSSYRQKTRTFHSEADFKRTAVDRVTIVRTADRQRLAALLEAGSPLPSTHVTVIADESPGATWVGTRAGALRIDRNGGSREYFAGQRSQLSRGRPSSNER